MSGERWHGSNGGYTNHGCRCGACTFAHRDELRRYRVNHTRVIQPATLQDGGTEECDPGVRGGTRGLADTPGGADE